MTKLLLDVEATRIETVAKAAHEVNRIYCAAIGDTPQVSWEDAPEWQRESIRIGVRGVLAGNDPEASHKSWLAEKERTGWKYGPKKDPELKTHPCMRPYQDLPVEQRSKDALFCTVVCVTTLGLMVKEDEIHRVVGSC